MDKITPRARSPVALFVSSVIVRTWQHIQRTRHSVEDLFHRLRAAVPLGARPLSDPPNSTSPVGSPAGSARVRTICPICPSRTRNKLTIVASDIVAIRRDTSFHARSRTRPDAWSCLSNILTWRVRVISTSSAVLRAINSCVRISIASARFPPLVFSRQRTERLWDIFFARRITSVVRWRQLHTGLAYGIPYGLKCAFSARKSQIECEQVELDLRLVFKRWQ